MAHHKIWESGRHPSRRPDKGKKKPQAIRQAKKRLAQFKKRHMNLPNQEVSSYYGYIRNKTDGSQSRNQIPTCSSACY